MGVKGNQVICRECGQPMVARARKSDGHKFYGCSDYPRCNNTMSLDEVASELVGEHGDYPEDRYDRSGDT